MDVGPRISLAWRLTPARRVSVWYPLLIFRYGNDFALVGAELAVSINWPTIVGADVIGLFPRGVVNAHCGDLPDIEAMPVRIGRS